jgi:hypothetical protein
MKNKCRTHLLRLSSQKSPSAIAILTYAITVVITKQIGAAMKLNGRLLRYL